MRACSALRPRPRGSRSRRPCRSTRRAATRLASCGWRRDLRRAAAPRPSRLRRRSPSARRASTKARRRARGRARREGVRSKRSRKTFSPRPLRVANDVGARVTMYVAGEWRSAAREEEICNPYDGEVVGVVPVATPADAELAVTAAVEGAAVMRALSGFERAEILRKAADATERGVEELARTIALEVGKPLAEARGEAARIAPLLRTSAAEGARMHGETVPVDSAANGAGKLAFTLRQPCGVVVAISPFNYPALLVAPRAGPALGAGNAVVLKPARQTRLTALFLTRTLLEAGLPENAIQCVTGPGAELGRALCADPRVRKISFTGSTAVGEDITRVAGVKRLSLELGANCPLIVLPDADLDRVAEATASGGYVNAGQVCISVQRILVAREVYGDFVDALTPLVEGLRTGHPLDEETGL